MPFLPIEEEEKKVAENISGPSTSFNTQQAPKAPSASSSSGQYTNINKYLTANQDQAQAMGSELTSMVENQAEKAKSSINDLEKSVVKAPDLDPTKYLDNPSSISSADYNQLKNTGGYSGPKSIDELKTLDSTMKTTNEASQKVKALGSDSGVKTLLSDQYNRPSYSSGELNLDNVLVRNDSNTIDRINSIQNKYSNLNNMLSNTTTKVGNSIAEAQAQALKNKEKFIPAEQAAWQRVVEPIQERVAAYNEDKDQNLKNIMDDLANSRLNATTINELGINPADIGNLYDLDLSKYIITDQSEATLDNIANSEERARYAALRQLIGDPTRTEIGEENATIDLARFNTDAFIADKESRQRDLATTIANQRNQLKDIRFDTPFVEGGQYSVMADRLQSIVSTLQNDANLTPKQIESLLIEAQGIMPHWGNGFSFGGPNRDDQASKDRLNNYLNAINQYNINRYLGEE